MNPLAGNSPSNGYFSSKSQEDHHDKLFLNHRAFKASYLGASFFNDFYLYESLYLSLLKDFFVQVFKTFLPKINQNFLCKFKLQRRYSYIRSLQDQHISQQGRLWQFVQAIIIWEGLLISGFVDYF